MTLEFPPNKNTSPFPISWKMIYQISRIERFDELWPAISKKEQIVISKWSTLEKHAVYDLATENDDNALYLADFQKLTFWYETETEIHPLVKCLIYSWYLLFIPFPNGHEKLLCIETVVERLIESGYTWVCYIPIDGLNKIVCGQHLKISHWILSALEVLVDGQSYIMDKIDAARSDWKLIASKELLLYIIEHNPRIRTKAIAKKLGASISTVKKMLKGLVESKMIERNGIGRGTHYRLL